MSAGSSLRHTWINLLDCGNGNGSSRTAFTTVNNAVVAPMPNASVRIAVTANPGARSNNVKPCLRSRSKSIMPRLTRTPAQPLAGIRASRLASDAKRHGAMS